MSSASRGLAPREGLECLLVKMGRTGPLVEPHHGPQAGKSGDPRFQNANMFLVVKSSRDIYSVEVYTVGCDGHFQLLGPL